MKEDRSTPTEVKLKKSPAMIAAGYGNVNATVHAWMIDDGQVGEHEWWLVYRWGKPRPGRKPVFAAQTKINRKVVQLHRFIFRLHAANPDAEKSYVVAIDGNVLNCLLPNLLKLTKAEWETRNHRDKMHLFILSEPEQKWLDQNSIALGYPRRKVYNEALRFYIESKGGLPPAPKQPDEFE